MKKSSMFFFFFFLNAGSDYVKSSIDIFTLHTISYVPDQNGGSSKTQQEQRGQNSIEQAQYEKTIYREGGHLNFTPLNFKCFGTLKIFVNHTM